MLLEQLEKIRAAYRNKTIGPQHDRVTKLEMAINSGRFPASEVEEALRARLLFAGQMQSYYVVLV